MGKHRRDSKGEYSRGGKPALKMSSSNQAKEETFVKCSVLLGDLALEALGTL